MEPIQLTNEELQEITSFYTRELSENSTALNNPDDLRTALQSINVHADAIVVKELFRRYHTYADLPRGGGAPTSRTASGYPLQSRPTSAVGITGIAINSQIFSTSSNELSIGRGGAIVSTSKLQQPSCRAGPKKKAGGALGRTMSSLRAGGGVTRVDSFYTVDSPLATSRSGAANNGLASGETSMFVNGFHACEGGNRMSCSSLVNICRAIKAFALTSQRQREMARLQPKLLIGSSSKSATAGETSSASGDGSPQVASSSMNPKNRFAAALANDNDMLAEADLKEALSSLQPPAVPRATYQKLASSRERARLITASSSLSGKGMSSPLSSTGGTVSAFAMTVDSSGNKIGGHAADTAVRKFLGISSPRKNEMRPEEVKRLMKYVPFAEDIKGVRVATAPDELSDCRSDADLDGDEDENSSNAAALLSGSANFEITEEDQDLYVDIATVSDADLVTALAKKMNAIARRKAAKDSHKRRAMMENIQSFANAHGGEPHTGNSGAFKEGANGSGDSAVRMFAVQKVLEGYLSGGAELEDDTAPTMDGVQPEPSSIPSTSLRLSRPTSASGNPSSSHSLGGRAANNDKEPSAIPSTRLVAKDGLLEDPLLYAVLTETDLRVLVGMGPEGLGVVGAAKDQSAHRVAPHRDRSPNGPTSTASTSGDLSAPMPSLDVPDAAKLPLVGSFLSSQSIEKGYRMQLQLQQQAGLVKGVSEHGSSAHNSNAASQVRFTHRAELIEDTRLLRSLLYGYGSDDEVEELQAVKAAVAARGAKEVRVAAAAKKLRKVVSSANLLLGMGGGNQSVNAAPLVEANQAAEPTDPLDIALLKVERRAAIQERLYLTPYKQQRLDNQMVAEHVAATEAEAAALIRRREAAKAKAATLTTRQQQDRETIRALRTRRRSMARIHFQRDDGEGEGAGPTDDTARSQGFEDSAILSVAELTSTGVGGGLSSAPTSFPRRRSSIGSTSSNPNTISTQNPGSDGGDGTSSRGGNTARPNHNGSMTVIPAFAISASPRKAASSANPSSLVAPAAVYLTPEEVAALRRMSEERAKEDNPVYQQLREVIERYVERQRQAEERAGLQTTLSTSGGVPISVVANTSRGQSPPSRGASVAPSYTHDTRDIGQHHLSSLSAHLLISDEQRQAHAASLAAAGKSAYLPTPQVSPPRPVERVDGEPPSQANLPTARPPTSPTYGVASAVPPRALSATAITLSLTLAATTAMTMTNGSFASDNSSSMHMSPLVSPHGVASHAKKGHQHKKLHPPQVSSAHKGSKLASALHSINATTIVSTSDEALLSSSLVNQLHHGPQKNNTSYAPNGATNTSFVSLTPEMLPYGIVRPPFAGSFESNAHRWEKLRSDEHTRVVTDDDNRQKNAEHTKRLEAAFEVCEMPYETFVYTPQLRCRPKKMPIFFHKSFAAHAHSLEGHQKFTPNPSLQNSSNNNNRSTATDSSDKAAETMMNSSFTPPSGTLSVTPRRSSPTPRQAHAHHAAPHPTVMAKKLPYLSRSNARRLKDKPLLGRDNKVFAHPFIAAGVAKSIKASDEDEPMQQSTTSNLAPNSLHPNGSRAGSAGPHRDVVAAATAQSEVQARPQAKAVPDSQTRNNPKTVVVAETVGSGSPVAEASRHIRATGRENPKTSHMSVAFARSAALNATVPSLKVRAASASGIAASAGNGSGSGVSYYGGHALVRPAYNKPASGGSLIESPSRPLSTVNIAAQSWQEPASHETSPPSNSAPLHFFSSKESAGQHQARPFTSLDFARTAPAEPNQQQGPPTHRARSLSMSLPFAAGSGSTVGSAHAQGSLTALPLGLQAPRVSMHEGYNHQPSTAAVPHDKLRRSSVSMIEQHAQQLAALQQQPPKGVGGGSPRIKGSGTGALKSRPQSPLPASYYQKEQSRPMNMSLTTLQVGRKDLRQNVVGMIDQFLNNNREERFLPWKN